MKLMAGEPEHNTYQSLSANSSISPLFPPLHHPVRHYVIARSYSDPQTFILGVFIRMYQVVEISGATSIATYYDINNQSVLYSTLREVISKHAKYSIDYVLRSYILRNRNPFIIYPLCSIVYPDGADSFQKETSTVWLVYTPQARMPTRGNRRSGPRAPTSGVGRRVISHLQAPTRPTGPARQEAVHSVA